MAFLFRLKDSHGPPVEPSTLRTAVPNWRSGDTIPLGRRTLLVVGVRDDDADQPPALVVEDRHRRNGVGGQEGPRERGPSRTIVLLQPIPRGSGGLPSFRG